MAAVVAVDAAVVADISVAKVASLAVDSGIIAAILMPQCVDPDGKLQIKTEMQSKCI